MCVAVAIHEAITSEAHLNTGAVRRYTTHSYGSFVLTNSIFVPGQCAAHLFTMGRKKSTAKKVKTKKKQVISTTFKCPFCGHDGAVEVKM